MLISFKGRGLLVGLGVGTLEQSLPGLWPIEKGSRV